MPPLTIYSNLPFRLTTRITVPYTRMRADLPKVRHNLYGKTLKCLCVYLEQTVCELSA